MATDSLCRRAGTLAAAFLVGGLLIATAPCAARPDSNSPADEGGAGFSETHVWLEGPQGYAEGQRLAKASGRPVVVYFYTGWCHYCRELERELLDTAAVRSLLKGFVKVKIDAEAGPAEDELAGRHGVASYPGFFIGSPRTGGFVAVRRYVTRNGEQRLMTPAEFVESCRKAAGM